MAKRSSDPRVAYPEVKVQIRDLVRVVGIVGPFAPRWVSIRGKFVLSSRRGVNWHRRPVPGAPSSGTPRESQAKVRDGTVLGLYKGPLGSVFGESLFYRETWGTRLWGSPCG